MLKNNQIQHWLNQKGWKLYNHQLEVIKQSFFGNNILLNSPTGSGKTLAGFLPSLIDLLKNKKQPELHTLYISPLKSLTYDIERNLLKPIEEAKLKISIESRTGDTSYKKKKLQIINPPNILATTIETFALLMSEKKSYNFFQNLKFIIIDEIHSILNTKRGELLSLNLSRLNTMTLRHQTILLSATISNPDEASNYFTKTKCKLIKIKDKKPPQIKILYSSNTIPWSGHMANYAMSEIYKKIEKRKSIIFVNTRAQSELMYHKLSEINSKNLKIEIHHGSLEKNIRIQVEEKMANNKLNCIIATSSLDLGIDWTHINLVIQIGAPKGISRFFQRVGRCNHNFNKKSEAYLVPTNRFDFIECYATIKAIEEKELDSNLSKEGSLDVLAQHIIGVSCSKVFDLNSIYKDIKSCWPYRNIKKNKFLEVINFLVNGGYSLKNYNQFSRLKKINKNLYTISSEKFAKQYKMNVGTIVESEMLNVKMNNKTLGQIEDWFIQKLKFGDTFLFGGMILKFESLKLNNVMVKKTSSSKPRIPSYSGGRIPLSSKLSKKIVKILNNEKEWKSFPKNVVEWLKFQKEQSVIPSSNSLLIESFERNNKKISENYYIFYTFLGYNANQTLGFIISKRLDKKDITALGFICNDIALVLWVDKKIDKIMNIFERDNFKNNFFEWIKDSSLLKRNFRKIAIISGLLSRGYPNQKKMNKQLSLNSDLIFSVLNKYEKNHILIESTIDESKRDLVEFDRINNYLDEIVNRIELKKLKKPSPLSIPLILELNKEYLNKSKGDEFYLKSLEKELLKEVGME